MKAILVSCVVLMSISSYASADANLAASKNCMACHAVEQKIMGPSFKEVAAKYRGTNGAESKLVEKVRAGGVGVWGTTPMPPNGNISKAEAHTVVKWVLSQK